MRQTDFPFRTINSREEIHDAKFYITFPHKSTLKDFILLIWRNKIRYHNLITIKPDVSVQNQILNLFFFTRFFLAIIHIYQFWKNDKGTPFGFILKMQQNWISYGKIDICVIFIKHDVAVWKRICYVFFLMMKINGPVVGGARGGGFCRNFSSTFVY